MKTEKSSNVYKMVLSSMFLALALVLPFITGQIPEIGGMLCPMHIPVLLCGYFCGPFFGLLVGIISPLLRFLIFGMPPIMPTGLAMAFELGTYGLISGLLYKMLPKKTISVYISLLIAMLAGRVVWGLVRLALLGINGTEFSFKIFLADGFVTAVPGIIVQILLVPSLVIILKKYTAEE